MVKLDVYMSYRYSNESQNNGGDAILRSTTVSQHKVVEQSELNNTIKAFINEMPDNVKNFEIYAYETEDIATAVAKF